MTTQHAPLATPDEQRRTATQQPPWRCSNATRMSTPAAELKTVRESVRS